MKRKFLNAIGMILGCAIVLTGCANSAAAGGTKDAQTSDKQTNAAQEKVVFAYWGAETENAAIKKVIANFQEIHPEIAVEAQWIQKDYLTKVQVQIAGNTKADVYLMSAADLPGFADSFMVQEADSANFLSENVVEALRVEGELKGKPFIVKPKVMAINKNLFEQNGLAIPNLTTSMSVEEFYQAAEAIVDDTAEPQVYGSEPLWMGNWIYSFGGSYYKNDGMESNLAAKEVIDSADFIIKMKDNKLVPDDNQAQGQSMMDWFLSGRIGMFTDFGPWSIPQMRGVKGFEWELVPVPGDGGAKEVDGLAITKDSQHLEAAKTFVNYLCENEDAQKIIGGDENAYGIPVNKEAVKSFETIYEGKNLKAFVLAAETQTPAETQKKTNEINSVLKKVNDNTGVGTGSEKPADAFPAIAEEITAILNN